MHLLPFHQTEGFVRHCLADAPFQLWERPRFHRAVKSVKVSLTSLLDRQDTLGTNDVSANGHGFCWLMS